MPSCSPDGTTSTGGEDGGGWPRRRLWILEGANRRSVRSSDRWNLGADSAGRVPRLAFSLPAPLPGTTCTPFRGSSTRLPRRTSPSPSVLWILSILGAWGFHVSAYVQAIGWGRARYMGGVSVWGGVDGASPENISRQTVAATLAKGKLGRGEGVTP
jgi:hypothetical protein